MTAKPLIWVGSSRADVRAFPADARRIAGFQLWRVQRGLDPNDWEPMLTVGVYVLHAFEKRSWKTPQRALDIAGHRLRLLLREREKGWR